MGQSPDERMAAAPIPAPRRRPIMTVGVVLVAMAILAIIVLVPSMVHSRWDLATAGAWPLAALMVLSFCVPCVAVIVIVVMSNLEVPRFVRYALAVLAFLGASMPFCIAFMACVSETDSQGAQVAYSVLKAGLGWFCAGLAVLGACLGLSLPVADRPRDEKPLWDRPRRAHTIAVVGVLGWCGAVYQLVYNLAPYFVGSYAHGALTYFIAQSVAAPMTAFFVTAFVVAMGWTQADFPEHRWIHRILMWVPLALFLLTILNSFLDTVTLHGSYSLSYAAYRISGVYVLEMCLLGILFGVGLSGIRD